MANLKTQLLQFLGHAWPSITAEAEPVLFAYMGIAPSRRDPPYPMARSHGTTSKRRDEMIDRPEAANGMVKALRQLFRYAIIYDDHDRNPATEVEYLHSGSDGFHAWTLEEITQFEAIHPIGSMARLTLALAPYTGQRRADIVQFGKQHVREGWLVFTQKKNGN